MTNPVPVYGASSSERAASLAQDTQQSSSILRVPGLARRCSIRRAIAADVSSGLGLIKLVCTRPCIVWRREHRAQRVEALRRFQAGKAYTEGRNPHGAARPGLRDTLSSTLFFRWNPEQVRHLAIVRHTLHDNTCPTEPSNKSTSILSRPAPAVGMVQVPRCVKISSSG